MTLTTKRMTVYKLAYLPARTSMSVRIIIYIALVVSFAVALMAFLATGGLAAYMS
jgi:hypothetical protein